MSEALIVECVKGLIPSLDPEQIKSEAKLKDELGIDSLKMVELLVNLEERFNIMFDESDLDPGLLGSVQDLENLVNRYVK
ncbi:acyl carrier protein [Paenibacillus sp. NPDC058071]|uniref:acyl carrier protein n=1 Tax=Paenibacillus sp. NPDC058071 TaxID=3346326 RepID=UPI0036DD15BC